MGFSQANIGPPRATLVTLVTLCLGQFDVLSTPLAGELVLVYPISTTVYYTPCRPFKTRSYYAMKVFIEDFYCDLVLMHIIYLLIDELYSLSILIPFLLRATRIGI